MQVSHDAKVEDGQLSDIVTRIRDVIRRRWLTLALVVGGVFAIGVVFIMLMTPKYTSTTHVRIDPSRTPVMGADSPSQALSPEAIETEVAMITSNEVATEVVKKLNLVNDPEFAPEAKAGAVLSPADKVAIVVGNVLDGVNVSRNKLSYILGISYTSPDRAKSAKIANAFATAYISTKVGTGANTASKKAEFLKAQLDQLGADIRGKEAQLASYQAQTGIVTGTNSYGGNTGTVVDQQLGPLSGELAQAQSASAQTSAALAAAQAQVARSGIDSVGEVLASPVVGNLRTARAAALRDLGNVLSRYGDKHPDTIAARANLADIDQQISAESSRIMNSLRSNDAAAKARVAQLQSSINGLAGAQADNARKSVLAKSLDAEVTTERAQFDKLSQNLMEMQQAANNSIAQVEIVDTAAPPLRPTSPNKPLLMALALLVALSAGTATVTVQEMLVQGLRSVSEVEELLGVKVLAAIPREKHAAPADILLEKPTSLFAEAFRIARASLLGVRSDQSPKVIAITSALPAEGKTTSAVAFARTLALNGQKTLLIDCDVRRANVRQIVRNAPDIPGLVEVLHGEASVLSAISGGDTEHLDHLLVRTPYFSSENLFGDGKMLDVLKSLRGRYEAIVLDLPPLMGLADGRFLAAMADAVAMVVRWDETPAQAAASAVNSLRTDGSNIAGVIFTLVDAGSEAVGGYYYSKKYTGYYQAP